MLSFQEYNHWTSLPLSEALYESGEDLAKVLDKIRKLLALAARPGTEGEGIAARTQAEKMAQRHGIDLATLRPIQAAPTQPEAPEAPQKPIHNTGLTPLQRAYVSVLIQYGWRKRWNPFEPNSATFGKNSFDRRDHLIILHPEAGMIYWEHRIAGLRSFSGTTPEQLSMHLSLHS
jgi:Protein of unknown function (DUF2786)